MDCAFPNDLPDWPAHVAQARLSGHGDMQRWQAALAALPPANVTGWRFDDTIRIEMQVDVDLLTAALHGLHPWRKGPFQLGPVLIDSEWRSDLKWRRIAPHLDDLQGHRVLDIGCGNGYFGWRMLDAGASEVIGIDPTVLFHMQHQAVNHYLQQLPATEQRFANWVLPLKIEEIPATVHFDSVFTMGVIYHRRDPVAHLRQALGLTRAGGQLVLETLVVEGDTDLIPEARYARMRNVWCVPSLTSLQAWLQAAGFVDIRLIDVTPTGIGEQRTTPWMRFESLAEALQPADPTRTVEGHPAPLRAVVLARRPEPGAFASVP